MPSLLFYRIAIILICLTFCYLSHETVHSTGDVWRRGPDSKSEDTIPVNIIKTLSNKDLIDILKEHPFSKDGILVRNEIIERNCQNAIPILESIITTHFNYSLYEIGFSIVQLELNPVLKGKDDIQQLNIVLQYLKKYSPQGNEYANEFYWTGFKSVKAVRYRSTMTLVQEINKKLEASKKYQELIDIYNKYIQDQDSYIRMLANSYSKIYKALLQKNQQREFFRSELQNKRNEELIQIIDQTVKEFQQNDYSNSNRAYVACQLLVEKKSTKAIPSLITLSKQPGGKYIMAGSNHEAIREAKKSAITLIYQEEYKEKIDKSELELILKEFRL